MADKTTTGLTGATLPLDGTELHYVVQGGNSRKVAGAEIVKIAHNQAFSTITGTPTTLSGYGITDAATAAQGATADSAVQPGDLATVATTGAYADLSGKPTLGTAAATAATDYATAGQGATADSALQPSDIGGSVQAQGATLDSLEALPLVAGDVLYATGPDALARLPKGADGEVLKLAAGLPAWGTVAGTGDMLESVYDPGGIGGNAFDQDNMVDGTTNKNYTSTEKTKLGGIEAGADVTDAANVAAAGALMASSAGTTGLAVLAAEDLAEAFTALGTPLTANTMLVDNAAGTAREAKTFAQVKELLEIGKMPWIDASKYGVTGDGSDQTAAFQNLIDNIVPASGAIVSLPAGSIVLTSQLDMHGRHNISFEGQGSDLTYVRYTGVGGSTFMAIYCATCLRVNWRRIGFLATNTAFTGSLLSYGKTSPIAGDDSAYNVIAECTFGTFSNSPDPILIWLDGATLITIRDTAFNWRNGCAIHFTTNASGFSNVIKVDGCQFGSSGTGYPLVGSPTGFTLSNNNFQACADGKLRVWLTAVFAPFRGLFITGNTLFDAWGGGLDVFHFHWGYGLSITGNFFSCHAGDYLLSLGGGGTGGDPQTKGCLGVHIAGNHFTGDGSHIAFYGTIANKQNARGIVIQGNSIINGNLLASYAEAEQMVVGPNSIYSYPNAFGANLSFHGLPFYTDRAAAIAAGLTTGQVFSATGGWLAVV